MNKQPTDLRMLLKDPSLLQTRAYVAGEWIDADDGTTFPVVNPARGDIIAEVADLSRAEVARAIAASAAATAPSTATNIAVAPWRRRSSAWAATVFSAFALVGVRTDPRVVWHAARHDVIPSTSSSVDARLVAAVEFLE